MIMKKMIRNGLRAIIVLAVIYAAEMAVLGFIYRFLSEVPYRAIAPPVVVVVVLGAWVTIFVDMKKRGKWWGELLLRRQSSLHAIFTLLSLTKVRIFGII